MLAILLATTAGCSHYTTTLLLFDFQDQTDYDCDYHNYYSHHYYSQFPTHNSQLPTPQHYTSARGAISRRSQWQ